MANYNLTSQQIKDTFEQLGQISGSIEGGVSGYAIVDGTGSRVNVLHATASYATTASFALNGGGGTVDTGSLLVTSSAAGSTITFTKGDGTTYQNTITTATAQTASIATRNVLTSSAANDTITFTKGDGTTYTNVINNVSASLSTEEIFVTAKNVQGVSIPKGYAVHANGVTGENVNITTASYLDSSLMPAIGITQTAINAGAAGEVIISGRLKNVNTSTLVAGNPVYVNGEGALTATKPTGSALIQNIGICAKVNATEGEIIVMGAGRSNDVPNISPGYAWVGNSDSVATAVPTSSFSVSPFPFTGNAQITGSLVVSQSGLSSGDDVFLLGGPRTGGTSLQGVIRSTVDDGMHLYGNKNFNNGANTFGGGQVYFEAGPVNFGSAGSPVNLVLQNGSAITASNGTLPISGNVNVDGDVTALGGDIYLGDNSNPNHSRITAYGNYSGSTERSNYLAFVDSSGTYPGPPAATFGAYSIGGVAGSVSGQPYAIMAGGSIAGEKFHWGIMMDQTGDIKTLKKLSIRNSADLTGSLNVTGSINGDIVSTGTSTFNDITVNGTGSFNYIQSITGSAKVIGDAFLILNNDLPAERYAGIKVLDTGSTTNTASLVWDGQTNDWFYEFSSSGTHEYGVVMMGPEYTTQGSPTYLSSNTIPKGNGGHHLEDTNITDDGTDVKINSNTQVTGSFNVSGALDVNNGTGNNKITGSLETTGYFWTKGNNYSSNNVYAGFDGSGGFSIDNISGTGNQFGTYVAKTNSTTFAGNVYQGFQLVDQNSTGSYRNSAFEISTYTGLDASWPVISLAMGPDNGASQNKVMWTSKNYPWIQFGKQVNFLSPVTASAAISASAGIIGDLTGNADTATTASYVAAANVDGTVTNASTASFVNALDQELIVTGSVRGNVTTLSISSQTASIDASVGDYYTLTLVSGSNTHIDSSNINPGKTFILKTKQPNPGSGTISFDGEFKFASGTAPTATDGADKEDIYTFVAFDSTNVYSTQVADLT